MQKRSVFRKLFCIKLRISSAKDKSADTLGQSLVTEGRKGDYLAAKLFKQRNIVRIIKAESTVICKSYPYIPSNVLWNIRHGAWHIHSICSSFKELVDKYVLFRKLRQPQQLFFKPCNLVSRNKPQMPAFNGIIL